MHPTGVVAPGPMPAVYCYLVSAYLNILFSLCTIAITGSRYTTWSETTMSNIYGEFKDEEGKFAVPNMSDMERVPAAPFGKDDRAAADLSKKIEEINKRLDSAREAK